MATVLFLHGWTSKPRGLKPSYLASHGHHVLNPALPDDDFAESVRITQAEIERHHPAVIVGSSRGGAVAMNANSGLAALVLICPAWKKYGTATTIKLGTVILHSEADDVVPIADSRELLTRSGLPAESLVVVGNDHRLADSEALAAMLEAVEKTIRPQCSVDG
jgi:alpha-beta hydrolase superfamily lysophospholipase